MELVTTQIIESKIFTFQGKQVMVDRDLAELNQVEVKRLNEQVKRNITRFPDDFRFQLSDTEKNELVANCDRIEIRLSNDFHDRFLIIDKKTLYHIGASLKDLGKKCFAFSVIEDQNLLQNLITQLHAFQWEN